MHARTLRTAVSSFVAVLPVLGLALPAAAQQPAPPDVVFEPMVTAAEGERLHHADVAHAHAEAALRFAPDGSALAARAHAIVSATPAPRTPLTEDQVWEPLVSAAEADAAAGHRDLALDRLSAAMRVLSPGGALAGRARNLYAIVSGSAPPPAGGTTGTGTTTGTTGTGTTGAGTAGTGTTGTGTAGTGDTGPSLLGTPTTDPGMTAAVSPPAGGTTMPPPPGYGAVQPYPQQQQGQMYYAPQYNYDPTLRNAGEMIPYYAAAAIDGMVTGTWILVAAGVDPRESQGWYATLPLVTAAGFAIGAWALDDSSHGLRAGQPNAIGGGALIGALMAPFVVGAIGGYDYYCPGVGPCTHANSATSWTAAWVTGALGLVGGFTYAYGVKPRVGASLMMESTAIWGLFFGGMVGIAGRDSQTAWSALAIGTGSGAVLGAILGQVMKPTAERIGLLFAGFGGGMLVATIPLGVVSALGGTSDAGWVAAGLSIGALGGLVFVGVLTGGMVDHGDEPQHAPPVMVGAAPLREGGGMLTVSGAF